MQRWILIALMLFATTAHAQQVDLKSLDKLAAIAKEVTQINLDESMITSAKGILNDKKGDEAAAKAAAAGLKGLYMRVFEFEKKGLYKFEDLNAVRDQLKSPAWGILLQSRESNEQTEIWVHKTNGEPDGILLLAAEENELAVINVLGLSRLEDLSKIGQFGIPLIGGKSSESPKK
jgi:hypothetical protein